MMLPTSLVQLKPIRIFILLFLLFILNPEHAFAQTNAFISTWETTNANETITLYTQGGVGEAPIVSDYDCTIDWGDGTVENFTGNDPDPSHIYTTAGTHSIKITGTFPYINVSDCETSFFAGIPTGVDQVSTDKKANAARLKSIDQWGSIKWESMYGSFAFATDLVIEAADAPDLSEATTMYSTFFQATNFTGNLSQWNVSTIQDLRFTFMDDALFTSDLSAWEVGNVTSLRSTFMNCTSFNSDLSQWDVSQVQDISRMFVSCENFNSDLSQWNVGNVVNMSETFDGCLIFNSDLNNWDVSKVTIFSSMFFDAESFNSDLSNWNMSSANYTNNMFRGATSFSGDVSTWDVSNVTGMTQMFIFAENFNSDLSNWDVGNVTDMGQMFRGAKIFTSDLSNWNVSKVTDMEMMFSEAHDFNSDLSNWDVSNVTTMTAMFSEARKFNSDLSNWNVSQITSMYNMFGFAESFNGDVSTWDVSNVVNMQGMFSNAAAFNGDISQWNVSSVQDMRFMFNGASNFNSDLSNWDVNAVNDMHRMFGSCTSFDGDLSQWNTGNVMYMSQMFIGADKFNSDISNWNVSNVTTMAYMFDGAGSFDQNLGGWNITSVNTMQNMLNYAGISAENYDNTLIGWSTQNLLMNTELGASSLYYCNASLERQSIIDNFQWNIVGDSEGCPPSISDQTFSLEENSFVDTNVGQIVASDGNGESLEFSIQGVSEAFNIDRGTGNIIVFNPSKLDYETNPVFYLEVNVTNESSVSASATVTINLIDVNEAPEISTAEFSLEENSNVGQAVGVVEASDEDGGDVSFSITEGNESGAFSINSSTGELTVLDAQPVNFETSNEFVLTVEANDGALSSSADITITLVDVNEAPTDFFLDNNRITQGEEIGTIIGQFTTEDEDEGDVFTYQLIEGEQDNASFMIEGDQLLSSEIFDAEVKSSYTVSVTSTDQDGLFVEKTFNVEISIVSGIGTNGERNITSFYPNPSKSKVTIDAPGYHLLKISNIKGQLIRSINLNDLQHENLILNVQSFDTGIYYMHFVGKGSSRVEKFVKK